ncbi:hypothetical protein F5B18DRAFT_641102 [Nemania serpens]|nr:hypothetical protein F5B18DRAFT_641102 [Nemania serpens]
MLLPTGPFCLLILSFFLRCFIYVALPTLSLESSLDCTESVEDCAKCQVQGAFPSLGICASSASDISLRIQRVVSDQARLGNVDLLK